MVMNKKQTRKAPTRQTSAQSYPSFNANKDEIMPDDKKSSDAADGDNEEIIMFNMLKELQRVNAKKAAARSATFLKHKNNLYIAARKKGNEIVRAGTAHLEEVKAKLVELLDQEPLFDKRLKDIMPTFNARDESTQSLLNSYATYSDDLFPRRAGKINAASAMLEANPASRESSRVRLLKSAKAQLDEGLEEERMATDAPALIKHYKALLLS